MTKRSLRTSALPLVVVLFGFASGAAVGCGSEDDNGSSSSGTNGFGKGDSDAAVPNSSCAASTKRAEQVPVDIGLALDTSFSMDFDGKSINTKAALKAFVNDPAYEELGLALEFFPVRKQCSVADYTDPTVPVGLLPSIASQVSTALDAQQMELGTPMVQVLQGMTQYMRTHASATPVGDRSSYSPQMVFPNDSCTGTEDGNTPNTLENAIKMAGDAKNGTPSIPVFVIGVGTELVALDQIAAAGGTNKAILVDPTKNVQEALLQAFETIRKTAIPCDYPIPASGTGPVDPTKVNVTYGAATVSGEAFGFVGAADKCAASPDTGWYFDDPAKPAKVILCPKTCERVNADLTGQVSVVFGCARRDVVK